MGAYLIPDGVSRTLETSTPYVNPLVSSRTKGRFTFVPATAIIGTPPSYDSAEGGDGSLIAEVAPASTTRTDPVTQRAASLIR